MFSRLCFTLPLIAAVTACSGEIYLRDGVTDGDTFYLSQQALVDSDPVLQSWVSYTLSRSACQLQIGGDNPARNSSFACEVTARRHLVETWSAKKEAGLTVQDAYLDALYDIDQAAYLDEYVVLYFARKNWSVPDGLDVAGFKGWQRKNLAGHKPETRIIGSWNYARDVSATAGRD